MTRPTLLEAPYVSDASGIPALATELTAMLTSTASGRFCLWLQGGLGAGKTTLTGALLRSLGLSARQPVTSPTYTYMNEYEIAGKWYAHLDLYRAGAQFSPEDIGLVDAHEYQGIILEWPTQVPENPFLAPTHILDIDIIEDGAQRRYKLRCI